MLLVIPKIIPNACKYGPYHAPILGNSTYDAWVPDATPSIKHTDVPKISPIACNLGPILTGAPSAGKVAPSIKLAFNAAEPLVATRSVAVIAGVHQLVTSDDDANDSYEERT
ncbi:unnamed protein product [Cuscuta epithymum]|uniref:Uncharacterized protein n=1 Tax=Cuscuta epithymum TaxID=186058 RepID=A0AAV0CWI5_9ASTE|nr:unnamed protein product [Cuscuta epithymum]